MQHRIELIATACVAAAGLVAGGVAAAFGVSWGPFAALGALAVCGTLSGWSLWNTTRRAAAQRAATRIDQLTGLPNTSQLRDDVTHFLATRAEDEERTLLIFDLVGFKKYNDS